MLFLAFRFPYLVFRVSCFVLARDKEWPYLEVPPGWRQPPGKEQRWRAGCHIEIAIKINEGLGLALVGVLSGFSWLSLA